jgi:hypothetical protein
MRRSQIRPDSVSNRRLLVPVLAGLLVGIASTVPRSFPAQSLFETLVLAQASLLAIVVSVSMLSMQVSTNRFAPQLAQLYRESGFNAIIARFGVSILLDLALFALPASAVASIPTRAVVVGLAVGAASWAFVWLLEVEERLLVFLNPEPVLDTLVDSVSFERYHDFSVTRREEGRVSRNPILEIHQIVQTSLEQGDNYSALRAIDALEEATEVLLSEYASLPAERRRETAESLHKLFDYWNRIADRAVEEGADDTLHAVVDAESAIGHRAIELDVDEAATGAADALYHLCAVALANNRLESRYYETLGELLSDSIDDGSIEVAGRAITDLARLSLLVDRREDDLLVAADERIAPQEAFFEHWVDLLEDHGSDLESDQYRSLYRRFEGQYGKLRDEAIEDGRIDGFADTATRGLRRVGVSAAEADLQGVVTGVTGHVLSLAARTDSSPGTVVDVIEKIVTAGGKNGVAEAVRRSKGRTGEQGHSADDEATPIAGPVAGSESATSGSDWGRSIDPWAELGDVDRYVDEIERLLADR